MPQLSDWPTYDEANDVFTLFGVLSGVSLLDLTKEEARALAIVNLYCDVKKEKRGKAIPNHKKMSLCRAEWRKEPVEANLPTPRSRAAYRWLLENNPTYARYIERHTNVLASDHKNRFYITTANLLLHEHGIEVAIRPTLYPREAYGDSDVTERLKRLGRMRDAQKSSVRTSFLKSASHAIWHMHEITCCVF